MRLGQARTPDDRLYAIGDVHGCDDLLAEAHAKVAADLAGVRSADYRLIHRGDYVDRGPDSAAVVERLVRLKLDDRAPSFSAATTRNSCLPSSHARARWRGLARQRCRRDACELWGLVVRRLHGDFTALGAALRGRAARQATANSLVPPTLSACFGDFFFCHAGVRPGVALDRQRPDDLIWIREDFLESRADFGVVVIHGHTPVAEPEVLRNRIDIDTGAVFTGRLDMPGAGGECVPVPVRVEGIEVGAPFEARASPSTSG